MYRGFSAALSAAVFCCASILATVPANAQVLAPIWNGVYWGVHGGGSWGGAGSGSESVDLSGGLGGIHSGYQFQSGSLVYGVEGELTFGDVTGGLSDSYALDPILFGQNATFNGRLDLSANMLASLKGRIGYAFGPVMLYASGGLAWTWFDVEANATVSGSGFRYSDGLSGSDMLSGWTVGGGAEMKFTQSISGRIDVSHYNFQDDFSDGNLHINDVDLDFTVVRVGLSFQLN